MTGLQGSQGSNATGGLNSSKESEGVVDRYNKWVLSGPVQKFILFTVPQTFNEYLNPLYYAVNGTYGAVTGKDIVYNTPMGKGEAGINLAFAFIPGGTEELGAYRAGMRGLLKQETQQVARTGYTMASRAIRSALTGRAGKRGFTEVGYQFQKHFGRGGLWRNIIPKGAKLNPATFNEAGYKTFLEIWKAPGSFEKVGGFLEKRLPDGRGMRLQENWIFKGFLD